MLRSVVRLSADRRSDSPHWAGFRLALLLALATPAFAGRDEGLADLSLEQLGDILITSVSKRSERLSDAAASVFVISADDIRRTGAVNLPEALRLAPALQVARLNASQYAITARGFNGTTANKLLVLIDGRVVYTPLYSGVFWDAQDLPMAEIERIEVVSGPGATLWGSNAVNGVINVITRPAGDSRDGRLDLRGGDVHRQGSARYGGAFDGGAYRAYLKWDDYRGGRRRSGLPARDAWQKAQGGFRLDGGGASPWQVQGDLYRSEIEQTGPQAAVVSGGNLSGSWTRRFDNGDSLRFTGYYDRSEREFPGSYRDRMEIFDLDIQHSLDLTEKHHLAWGGGYRLARDHAGSGGVLAFLPTERNLDWINLYLEDAIALSAATDLTLGGRLERNDYSGWEFLPTLRLAWKTAPNATVWAALSRSVRSPSRIDRDLYIPGQAPYLLQGGPEFDSESSRSAEIGYRDSGRDLDYSITGFFQRYRDLRTIKQRAVNRYEIANGIDGDTWGVEAWANYRPMPGWRLGLGTLRLHQRYQRDADSYSDLSVLGNDPAHQTQLRSSHTWGAVDLDLNLRHVGRLRQPALPAYSVLDLRLGWRLQPGLELALVASNLFDRRYREFSGTGIREARRSLDLTLSAEF